jgi:hypothetical protein
MNLKLDRDFSELRYDSEQRCFVNCTKDRAVGLSRIVKGAFFRVGFKCNIAFDEESQTAVVLRGYNGSSGFLPENIEKKTCSMLLASYYSRQEELARQNNKEGASVRVEGLDGRVRKYTFV